jgi:hypothetical protein
LILFCKFFSLSHLTVNRLTTTPSLSFKSGKKSSARKTRASPQPVAGAAHLCTVLGILLRNHHSSAFTLRVTLSPPSDLHRLRE